MATPGIPDQQPDLELRQAHAGVVHVASTAGGLVGTSRVKGAVVLANGMTEELLEAAAGTGIALEILRSPVPDASEEQGGSTRGAEELWGVGAADASLERLESR